MSALPSNETTSSTSASIEQLIYDIAEQAKDEDYAQLYRSLANREVFIPVEEDSLKSMPQQMEPGDRFHPSDSASIQIRNTAGPRGEAMVPVATQAKLPIVAEDYVAIDWLEALAMVLTIENVAGILLQGENSWICFYKPQIENILKTYG